jgi:phenylacetate-CoA ligase
MNRWIERIYEQSPIVLQHAMLSAYGWKLARVRYGAGYASYLETLTRTQYFSETELAELQDDKLRRLIQHCYENVPYYAQLFRERKLTPADFRGVGDLAKLPVLDKETVRARPEIFWARNYLSRACETVSTSGTTGTTLRIRVDVEGRRQNYAFFSRFKHWAGVDPSARSATFAGRPIVPVNQQQSPFWRYNLACNNLLFSSYHLSEQNAPVYVEKLLAWNPQLIDSYPSSLHILARYLLDSGGQRPRPRAVITSSETLLDHQREAICRAFGTRVFDQYGSAEQVCFISECEQGTYHVHPEFGVVEFLPSAGADSEAGLKMVGTGFTNWAMPLLRYDTGDLAIPSDRKCKCGRHFKVVERIVGRLDDLVITPDGRRVGRLDPVFKGLTTVRQAQIIQESSTEIRVRVVPGEGFLPEHLDSIRHELKKRLGGSIEYTFQIVGDIPVGAGGKFQAVISRIGARST